MFLFLCKILHIFISTINFFYNDLESICNYLVRLWVFLSCLTRKQNLKFKIDVKVIAITLYLIFLFINTNLCSNHFKIAPEVLILRL